MDVLPLRPVPTAGLFMALTRRCPLACAHCSTNSLISSEEHPDDIFLRFADTFTPDNRPDLISLTGGEPLLRPKLVRQLTERAHAVGTKVDLISGMFFAAQPEPPALIDQAIAGLDHFAASLDVYHEQQVARADVFRVFQRLIARGQDVSFQVVGLDEHDPYLADVVGDIRRTFDDQVPVLVSYVKATGRASQWLERQEPQHQADVMPCVMAAWPVVSFDGTIVACCNQGVVDGPAPPHLRLGHAASDGWPTVRERSLRSPLLRAIRLFGPEYTAERHGAGALACSGYCATCAKLADHPHIAAQLEPVMARPTMALVEEQAVLLQRQGFIARYGSRAYADLAELGYAQRRSDICVA